MEASDQGVACTLDGEGMDERCWDGKGRTSEEKVLMFEEMI